MSQKGLAIRSIATKVAKDVGINSNIYDVTTDFRIHFKDPISSKDKRDSFEEKMFEVTGEHYKVVAPWFW